MNSKGTSAVMASAQMPSDDKNSSKPSVIIVGGGIAGISAARRLTDYGITDFVLLEAQDRLGGRIHTAEFGTGVIDLGAQWVHGRKGNPIYDLSVTHDLLCDSDVSDDSDGSEDSEDSDDYQMAYSSYEGYEFYTSSGKSAEDSLVEDIDDILGKTYKASQKLFNKYSKKKTTKKTGSEEDFQKPFGSVLQKHSLSFLNKAKEEEKELRQAFINWRKEIECIDNGCTSVDELSAFGQGKYVFFKGNNYCRFRNGFEEAFKVLRDDLPTTATVKLSFPVTSIRWKSGKEPTKANTKNCKNDVPDKSAWQVSVECKDGSVYTGNHVIVTVSLGVLKEQHEALFHPPLPTRHKEAISRMCFGKYTKFFLEWESPFWDCDSEGFVFIWLKSSPVKIPGTLTDKKTSKGEQWFDGFIGFDRPANNPNVLMGQVTGEKSDITDTLSDKEVMTVLVGLLQHFLGDSTIPMPKNFLRTSWSQNPFTRGAFSYIGVKTLPEDHTTLQAPVPSKQEPIVLLAGEACSDKHYSTTHGALLSGAAAVDTIMQAHGLAPRESSK